MASTTPNEGDRIGYYANFVLSLVVQVSPDKTPYYSQLRLSGQPRDREKTIPEDKDELTNDTNMPREALNCDEVRVELDSLVENFDLPSRKTRDHRRGNQPSYAPIT
ncbi:hypothetical protein RF11_08767 [Thelohanellus kitauei]|uniref:Uncharacterized protein n=1 Tax=Thelohanellus kitauei TaxID=669202 RepID=A0A0C2NBE0_THEKT|nr:hypothetical protein RF11_08767 [Thelohanellus kitauei]